MNKWLQMQEHDVVFSRGQRDPRERVVLGIRACSDPRTRDLTVNLDEPLFYRAFVSSSGNSHRLVEVISSIAKIH